MAVSPNNNDLTMRDEGDQNEEKKRKLKKQIQDMELLIVAVEQQLAAQKFRNIKDSINFSDSEDDLNYKFPQDVDTIFTTELYKLAGLHCTKFTKGEYVFEFSCAGQNLDNNIYAVQIFTEEGEGRLGKWVLPMSINVETLLTETPIKKLRSISAFVRNCRHHINCYALRLEQFKKLQNLIASIKNSKVYCNVGYTLINLQFFGVHNTQTDTYIDVTVYLMYDSDKIQPHIYKYETEKQDDATTKALKAYLKLFKKTDLCSAFEQVWKNDKGIFTWDRQECDNSFQIIDEDDLENETVSSNLPRHDPKAERSLPRKRRQNRVDDNDSGNEDVTSNVSICHESIMHEHKARKHLLKKQLQNSNKSKPDTVHESKVIKTNSKEKNSVIKKSKKQMEETDTILPAPKKLEAKNKQMSQGIKKKNRYTPIVVDVTPLKKPAIQLKQTKLNFEAKHTEHSKSVRNNPLNSKNTEGHKNKKLNLLTSTPLQNNKSSFIPCFATTMFEVSDIKSDG